MHLKMVMQQEWKCTLMPILEKLSVSEILLWENIEKRIFIMGFCWDCLDLRIAGVYGPIVNPEMVTAIYL